MNLPETRRAARWRFVSLLAGLLVIVAAGIFAYAPALRGGWVWDDDSEIVNNAVVRDPGGLGRIWSGTGTVDYFPLKTTLQWLQWHAWGDNPFPYRVSNLVLHLLSALIVWRLLGRLGLRCGWAGGLLFAVHPLAVESVAWIAEFKNAVSLPPLLLSVGAFLTFRETGRRGAYFLSVLLFMTAALCKSSVVMLPPILLLLLWWRNGRVDRHAALATVPFFGIALTLGLVTIWFQHERAMAGWEVLAIGIPERLGRAGAALLFYFGKSVLPVGLLPVYPRTVPASSPGLQLLAWLAVAAAAIVLWRRRGSWGRHGLLGLGWFILHLLPVLGLVNMAYLHFAWVADHFAYVSLVGIIGLGTGLLELAWRRRAGARWVVGAVVAAVAAAGVVQTRRHASLFHSEEQLWRYTLQHHPEAWIAHNNLAVALLRRQELDEALAHATAATRLKPDYATAHANAAIALSGLGRLDEAAAAVAESDRHGAQPADARVALAAALLRGGRNQEAIVHYEAALAHRPDHAEAHKGIGVALFLAGRSQEAIPHYRRGLQLAPDAATHANLGVALAANGQPAEALPHYREALRLAPESVEAHYNYGIALDRTGRPVEAQAQFEETVRLNPDRAEAHYYLGEILLRQGRPAQAIDAFRTALRLRPGLAEARARLEQLGRPPGATP